MDCFLLYAMSTLIGLSDRFDIAFGNDPDAVPTASSAPRGVDESDHYLAAADYRSLPDPPYPGAIRYDE